MKSPLHLGNEKFTDNILQYHNFGNFMFNIFYLSFLFYIVVPDTIVGDTWGQHEHSPFALKTRRLNFYLYMHNQSKHLQQLLHSQNVFCSKPTILCISDRGTTCITSIPF